MDKRLKETARGLELVVFDFDGVFTDNRVLVMEDGREAVLCNRSDGLGIEMARAAGLKMLVLSKEANPVVSARCRKLKLECIQSCDDKAARLSEVVRDRGLKWRQVSYLGNDINDSPCLELVGLPACVADAYPAVKQQSIYITEKRGGEGAVREFCDFILAAKTA
jgi:3-deoxy-D-manno-octulosonate 8-phosphate phosphatase (KDO 8-P phosphatase)